MPLQLFQIQKRFEDICEFVSSQIIEIEADPRYHYKPALVQVNAPLALIQVELGAKMNVLKKIQKMAGKYRRPVSRSSSP